jgi:2-C-methyl-D-erythritol 4-phosphate cytidylyltransferase
MVCIILVAGGQGRRMCGSTRKQYLMLGSEPILAHTLRLAARVPRVTQIVVAVPADDIGYCQTRVVAPLKLACPVELTAGGRHRQASVFNALRAAACQPHQIAVIHDAVRPFAGPDLFSACIDAARVHGAAIAAIAASDTLKQVDAHGTVHRTLVRDGVWQAQTPQAFDYELITRAHEQADELDFLGTDDASLVERLGHRVQVVAGSRCNIKITTPEDLMLAEALMRLST